MATDQFATFPNPPITEAVIEFRVKLAGDPHLGRLAAVQDRMHDRYPKRKLIQELVSNVQIGPDDSPPVAEAEKKHVGYKFVSSDEKQILQAKLGAFSFSRLRPYSTWREFKQEAMDLWAHYSKIARPEKISRIGVRYINRIDLPLPVTEFGDYIRTKPDLPPGIPPNISHFFMQLVIPAPDKGGTILLNQTLGQPSTDGRFLPLILDIDVFSTVEMDADSSELEPTLGRLRTLKNETFFSSLTDRAKELFK